MEIVASELACYRLLAFISLRMELHWRSKSVGKVGNNLPFFKELGIIILHKKVDSTAQKNQNICL